MFSWYGLAKINGFQSGFLYEHNRYLFAEKEYDNKIAVKQGWEIRALIVLVCDHSYDALWDFYIVYSE